MKLTKKHLFYLILFIILILPVLTFAQAVDPNLIQKAAEGADFPDADKSGSELSSTIPQTVGRLVSIILSFVGALFFIFIVVAGIEWMTAGGNEEKVAKARKKIIQAIIGLAITVAAYFITWFISNALGAA